MSKDLQSSSACVAECDYEIARISQKKGKPHRVTSEFRRIHQKHVKSTKCGHKDWGLLFTLTKARRDCVPMISLSYIQR